MDESAHLEVDEVHEEAEVRHLRDDGVAVSFEIENTGPADGTEVVQLYIGSRYCKAVRPVQELKAYARIGVRRGEKKAGMLFLPLDAFRYYDYDMIFGLHDGHHELMLGTSSDDIATTFDIEVNNGVLSFEV